MLENYWCSLPENAHKCKSVPLRRGWFQTLKGGIALFENLAYKKMVSPQVAEERAKICIACPHNIFPDKGAFIEWSDKIAEASTGGLTTPLSGELGNCEVCSCPLRAKIFYGGKITVTAEQREKMQKVNCWQIK